MSDAPMSFLEREVLEQGDVVGRRTEEGWADAARAADVLRREDVEYLMVAARGTSDNAARYAQYLLGMRVRLPVGLAAPWLYSGDSAPSLSHGALLAISQSGRSPDIVAVVEAARRQGRPTVVITNETDSPLAAPADVVVPLHAGKERSVAATKTYLASLHAIAQIAECLAPDKRGRRWFDRLPDVISAAAVDQLEQRRRFDRLAEATLITAVGRGLELATAHETALKIRELSGVPAEAFSLPDLIHGPIAALSESGAAWLISSSGRGQPDLSALEALEAAGGACVVVSTRHELVDRAEIGLRLDPDLPEWVTPMVAVLPGQAAALRLGELRGVDLDHPYGLHKVTLTS